MGLLDGRRSVVTGAGDIGMVVAQRLAAHGARTEVWDVSETALAAARSAGLGARVVDVSDRGRVEEAAARAWDEHGPVTTLVNTAAVARFGSVAEIDPDRWQETIDVNLTGVFYLCRAFAPRLAAAGGGSIVNISSIGGLRGEPDFSGYCASKFGVIGLTQSLAREVGPAGVRVNAVCPGAVASEMNTDTMARDARLNGTSVAEVEERIIARTALRRLVQPGDVADAVVFLASDLASGITAESLSVTGGIF